MGDDAQGGVQLAFVLTRDIGIDVDAVISAAAGLGTPLTLLPDAQPGKPIGFALEPDGVVFVMPIAAPHPDAATMQPGPIGAAPDEIAEHRAHLIVTAMGLPTDPRISDAMLTRVTAAVIRGSTATSAMLGHGVVFYRAELFAELAESAASRDVLPIEICVDLTAAREDDDRMSFLTHGLQRYGREEFYVTCPIEGQGALEFALGLTRWMLLDPDKQLPTGDTVGRTADERIEVQRVPSPLGEGPDVIRLDLP